MNVKIEKMDHMGSGIGFIENKIVFVPKTVTYDEVEVSIEKETKNYIKAKKENLIYSSSKRVEAFCPYYEKCGGCSLQNLKYDDTIIYKIDRLKNILSKIGINKNINVIKNDNNKYYRNKIELKVKNGKIGFYENNTHNIVEIKECLITKNCINTFLLEIKKMNIKNGDVLIRCNYNDELLISIKTLDDISLNTSIYPKYKVAGLLVNNNLIYGDDHFLDKINEYYFEVSYNSFFQVNSFINSELFKIINENVIGKSVLDLYSGVGTLSIMASKNANKVYAIENIPNAVINAIKNAKINTINNIDFILGNVEDKINMIDDNIDIVIVDPPRSGLDQITINKMLELNPSKIIYISCENQKLTENLKSLLPNYEVNKVYMLDMFSYSYHTECVCVLNRR